MVKLRIRAAKLNCHEPGAPLEVEIRDPTLKRVFAHGAIPGRCARLDFCWIDVEFDHTAALEEGQVYVFLFHSEDTTHDAPWVVNQVYRNVYPDGRQFGYNHDIFFDIAFRNGRRLRVGPAPEAEGTLPINSGAAGGCPVEGPLALHFPVPHPEIADGDPIGPVPQGEYVTDAF